MSMNTGTGTSGTPVKESAAGVAQTAKQEASNVASSAADNAKQIATEATTQAKVVAQQAKQQVTTLFDQTRHELRQTTDQKGQQAATGLKTLADQLRSLANGQPEQAGQLQQYVQEAQDRVSSFATRLENDGPQAVLEDVKRFARQRPAMFLAFAAGAGFAIGRVVRAGAAASAEQNESDAAGMYGQYGMTTPYAAPGEFATGTDYGATGDYASTGGFPAPDYGDTGSSNLSGLGTVSAGQSPTDHPSPTPTWSGDGINTTRGGEAF